MWRRRRRRREDGGAWLEGFAAEKGERGCEGCWWVMAGVVVVVGVAVVGALWNGGGLLPKRMVLRGTL